MVRIHNKNAYGHVSEFDTMNCDWISYSEHLDQLFCDKRSDRGCPKEFYSPQFFWSKYLQIDKESYILRWSRDKNLKGHYEVGKGTLLSSYI